MKPKYRINYWTVTDFAPFRLIGMIRDLAGEDEEMRQTRGFKQPFQISSPIVEMNVDEGWCETENSMYELGPHISEEIAPH